MTPTNDTPWMDWLLSHVGEHEVNGSKDNPFIMSLYKYGNYPEQHDEVPWCACTANAALTISGYKGTGSAAANSFANFGVKCGYVYGAILPITHKDGSHHVTFFHSWADESKMLAHCLGGNQGNALNISVFNLSGNEQGHDGVVSPRWPVEKVPKT